MKLELKHITPYLPYGLKVYYTGLCDDDVDGVFTVMSSHYNDNGISIISDKFDEIDLSESFFIYLDFPVKLFLRPIKSITLKESLELLEICTGDEVRHVRVVKCSDETTISGSTKEYNVCLFITCKKTHAKIYQNGRTHDVLLPYDAYEWLFKNHFDVFGLIDEGLAVDKTKLK